MELHEILEINGYSDFSCIGPDCEDHCCKNWTITVDKKTFCKYSSIKDKDTRVKILNSIKLVKKSDFHYGQIKLNSNGVCILQREDKLCTIHFNLGEDYLCRTCSVYPKILNKIDDVLEASYSLSCPAAVRKILFDKSKKSFNFIEKEIDEDFINLKVSLEDTYSLKKKLFWDIRSATIHILQARQYKLWQRIIMSGLMYKSL